MTVRQGDSDRALSVSTAALIHVDLPVACVKQKGQGQGQGQSLSQTQAQNLQIQAQAQAAALGGQGQQAQAPLQSLQPPAPGSNCDTAAPARQDQAAAATRPPG
jgi:hypothetical protein